MSEECQHMYVTKVGKYLASAECTFCGFELSARDIEDRLDFVGTSKDWKVYQEEKKNLGYGDTSGNVYNKDGNFIENIFDVDHD